MSPNQSLEEVMEKIRARVAGRGLRSGTPSGAKQTAPRETSTEPGSPAVAPAARIEVSANDLAPLHVEIETALEGTRRVGQVNPRNPGLFNSLAQFVKKVMRRSLTWYTRPLHYFQGGAIRALQQTESLLQSHERTFGTLSLEFNRQSELIENLSKQAVDSGETTSEMQKALAAAGETLRSVEKQLQVLEDKTGRFEQAADELRNRIADTKSVLNQKYSDEFGAHLDMINGVKDDIEGLSTALAQLSDGLRLAQRQGRLRDRDLRRFLHDLQKAAMAPQLPEKAPSLSPMFPTGVLRDGDFDYFGFEDLYRGDEADIGNRQKSYLEYFRGRDNVLDVGCGRGEFLELLRENNITAKGVELGTDQYLLCKEKGLDVVQQDLFAYLESLPDESLGGLFSAQVIEHLTASDQLRYVALAYQKTTSGSPVIFETINAQCVWAVMRNFFLDPTHVRPLHPETLKFAMETVKFHNVELRFSSPMKERQIPPLQLPGDVPRLEEFNQRIAQLNELLYGDQDYAAIGWR